MELSRKKRNNNATTLFALDFIRLALPQPADPLFQINYRKQNFINKCNFRTFRRLFTPLIHEGFWGNYCRRRFPPILLYRVNSKRRISFHGFMDLEYDLFISLLCICAPSLLALSLWIPKIMYNDGIDKEERY